MDTKDALFVAEVLRAEERSPEDIEKAIEIVKKGAHSQAYLDMYEALTGFVTRVANGDAKSPEEVRILPEIAKMFLHLV